MNAPASHAQARRRVSPRPSAILVLLRDGPEGLETLLLRRPEAMDFGGTWGFPGGLLAGGDAALAAACADHPDIRPDTQVPGVDGGCYAVAAIRECFEETGLLLAVDASGVALRPGVNVSPAVFASARAAVQDGDRPFDELCHAYAWRPAVERLCYMNYWVTPTFRRRRYATRFFVAPAPQGQVPVPQRTEADALAWIAPARALTDEAVRLAPPTRSTLSLLAALDDLNAGLAWARARCAAGIAPVLPVLHRDDAGERIVLPGDPCYPTDPEGLPHD